MLSIHDIDLKRWILRAREKIDLSRELFTASKKWIHNFTIKWKHGIVSRKINKFVTEKQISTKEKLMQESCKFVARMKSEKSLLLVEKSNIFNSDQSGFNLETYVGRMLTLKSSSKIERLAQSLNSSAHSYTIQSIVSVDGDLKSPLLIVLQEAGGKFRPIVEKTLYKADNIVTFASKSGKLTSDLVIKWFTDVFLPNTGKESVLCLDGLDKLKKFDDVDKANKNVKILMILAETTSSIQSLDVYTFSHGRIF